MNKDKRQKAILLITLISVYFAFSDLYTFFAEKVPDLDNQRINVEKQVRTKEEELAKLKAFAKNIETVKQELRELDIQLETALEALPRTANFAELLRRMDLLAQNSGVELQVFRPMSELNSVSDPKAFYSTLRVEFVVSGSFTQTLVFFDQVSRLKRLINLQLVRFSRETERRVATATDSSLRTVGTIKTYQFKQ